MEKGHHTVNHTEYTLGGHSSLVIVEARRLKWMEHIGTMEGHNFVTLLF